MSSSDPSDPLIGTTLGRCRLERMLGQGGMGQVYLARHTGLDLPVAVKILTPALGAQGQWQARFLQEARLAARIEHPNIVRVLDAGCERGVHFLVMEYIEGHSLADRLALGPLPPREALQVARDAARGLALAHEAGLVHRDVKPDNLMQTESGLLKVTDFGLARGGDTTGISITGQVLGTPAYMSPEQAGGEVVDQRTDIYSLGVTLYALLDGRSPFSRDNLLAALRATCEEPLPPLHRPGLPAGAWELLLRMCAKQPGQRPREMAEVVAALDRLLAPAASDRAPHTRPSSRTRARDVLQCKALPPAIGEPPSSAQDGAPGSPGKGRLAAIATAVVLLVAGLFFALSGGENTAELEELFGTLEGQQAEARKALREKRDEQAREKYGLALDVADRIKRRTKDAERLDRVAQAVAEIEMRLAEIDRRNARRLRTVAPPPKVVKQPLKQTPAQPPGPEQLVADQALRLRRLLEAGRVQQAPALLDELARTPPGGVPPARWLAVLADWRTQVFDRLAAPIERDLAQPDPARLADLERAIARLPAWPDPELAARRRDLRGKLAGVKQEHARQEQAREIERRRAEFVRRIALLHRQALDRATLEAAVEAYRKWIARPEHRPFLDPADRLQFELSVLAAVCEAWPAVVRQKIALGERGPFEPHGSAQLQRVKLLEIAGNELRCEVGGVVLRKPASLAQLARWAHPVLPRTQRELYAGVALCLAGKQRTREAQAHLARAAQAGGHPLLAQYRVKLADPQPTKTTPPKVRPVGHRLRRTFPDAELRHFVALRDKQPAERQLQMILDRLSELNGYTVVMKSKEIEAGKLVGLDLSASQEKGQADNENRFLVDITPLWGLRLKELRLDSTMVADLRPLAGMPLSNLSLSACLAVTDLLPLTGLPLTEIDLTWCAGVRRIDALRGKQLHTFAGDFSGIEDLSPLSGMPLHEARFVCTRVRDFAVLASWRRIDPARCPHVPFLLGRIDQAAYWKAVGQISEEWRRLAPRFYEPLRLLARGDLRSAIAAYKQAIEEDRKKWIVQFGRTALAELTEPPDPALKRFFRLRAAQGSLKKQWAFARRRLELLAREELPDHARIEFEPSQGKLALTGWDNLRDIRPLAGLPIRELVLDGLAVSDLRQVAVLRPTLRRLVIRRCPLIEDLSPLVVLTLERLELRGLPLLRDLRPLRGAPGGILVLGPRLARLPRK